MAARSEPERPGAPEALDVAIIGAGLSGVCAAWHLARAHPGRSFAVLEARGAVGGTWDLFRYPGIRSDSDMATLGYGFRPWTGARAIADGPSILAYIRETAAEAGLEKRIRLHHEVTHAEWSTEDARWHLRVRAPGGTRRIAARFVMACAGYYDYEGGHLPDWPGREAFAGRLVHPQHWPEDLDWTDRRVVVIGSGATAVTLVPEMARRAAHVTMLQRSPSHIGVMPAVDRTGDRLRRWLGPRAGHALTRWKNVLTAIAVYRVSRRWPDALARHLRREAARRLPGGFDVATHLTPAYDPWDQRLCLAPDGDLFAAISEGRADIVTDRIERFDAGGIVLASGARLDADVVVAATGLRVKIMGGIELRIDGRAQPFGEVYSYKGAMHSGVPNMTVALGYINASWTLKCELVARYAMRLLSHMDAHGHDYAVPRRPPPGMGSRPTFELSAGYLERARHMIPRQTERGPWRQNQNYLADLRLLGRGPVTDEMIFGRAGEPWEAGAPAEAAE